jgi:hypothetical protein
MLSDQPGAQPTEAAGRMAEALFRGFPGSIGGHYHGQMTIQIDAAFDSGNIRLLSIAGDRVDLQIVPDQASEFFQWFHFRVSGARGRRLTFRIVNAGQAAYAFGCRAIARALAPTGTPGA